MWAFIVFQFSHSLNQSKTKNELWNTFKEPIQLITSKYPEWPISNSQLSSNIYTLHLINECPLDKRINVRNSLMDKALF